MPSNTASSTAATAKVAEAWPAAIVTVAGTVPSVVSLLARLTVTAEVVGPVRVTVPVAAPAPPFSATLAGLIVTVRAGSSSLRMVPWPWLSAIVAPLGPLRFTKNASFGSTSVSPLTETTIVPLVWPAGIVSVPVLEV